MSHYVVLVIGDDPETQLEPFDENIEVEEYLVGPVPEDELESFLVYATGKLKKDKENYKEYSLEELYKKYGESWNGSSWKKNAEGTWEIWSTYNPDSKWDWYSLGGRWTGYFKLKPGKKGILGEPGVGGNTVEKGTCDQALKSAIDFEGMRKEASENATKTYDTAMSIIGHLPPNKPWADFDKSNSEKARTEYWAQDRCQAWRQSKDKEFTTWKNPDEFLVSKEDYCKAASDNSFVPFAILNQGTWISKGEMGMFGMSTDEFSQEDWNKQVTKLIDSLPDNTLISAYDLHI